MSEGQEGRDRRDAGIERVARPNQEWLEAVRAEARRICGWKGHVTADDLQAWVRTSAIGPPTHHNAWGAVFKEPGWKPVGWRNSTRAKRQAGSIRMWTWVDPSPKKPEKRVAEPVGDLFDGQ